ncbi:MAG: YbaY family lipoprotein [Metallibacterium scheffleri]
MRRYVLPLLIAATLLAAGCSGSSPTATVAAAPVAVSGTVSVLGTTALDGQGDLQLELVDVSKQPNVVVTSKTQTITTLPADFSLPFAATAINSDDLYVLNASMSDAQRKYITPIQYPVLTRGNSAQISVQLKPLPTPGEQALAGYEALKARIGGLKYTQGDQSEVGMSRGWQVFRDTDGKVVFVRELEDAGTKGFTSTEIAYRDGKPWVVVLLHSAGRGQKPSLVERAGWDAAGTLVLHERSAGGTTTRLDATDARSLYADAQSMLQRAGAGK